MSEQQACTLCGAGGHTAPGIIISGHQLRNALEFLAPDNSPEQLSDDLVIELHAKDDDFPVAGLYAYHSECPEEGAILLDDTAPAEALKPGIFDVITGTACITGDGSGEALPPLEEHLAQVENVGDALAQPSPAPELDDQAFDRNAERLTAKAFGTGGGINPNATSIDDLFLDESPAPELERPEVVAWLNTATGTATSHQVQVMDWDDEKEPVQSLMTVAQYDRIVGALLAEIAQLREALEWRKENQAGQRDVLRSVKAERDTAQARVAELHRCLQAIVNAADHGVWPTTVLHAIEMARAMLAGDAPVAQAGQVPEEWQPMSTAPKDGSIIRLLVNFEDMSIDDGDGPFATIGQNNFANDGEDRWQVVGWCWEHDHFTDGKGVPIGWLPMLAAAPAQGGE